MKYNIDHGDGEVVDYDDDDLHEQYTADLQKQVVQMYTKGDISLNHEQVHNVFVAIGRNNLNLLMTQFYSLNTDQQQLFLNPQEHKIDLKERNMWHCDDVVKQLWVTKPLQWSIFKQSFDCFKFLLENGASIYQNDSRENNIVHVLIYVYSKHPSQEIINMYDVLLLYAKTRQNRNKLLQYRSYDGLTPLELSVKLNCARMFKVILYTEGVYLRKVVRKGTILSHYFRFSNSVNDPKHISLSFLWQLVWLEDNEQSAQTTNQILALDPVKKLVQKRLYTLIPIIFVWFLCRCLLGILYYVVDLHHEDFDKNRSCNGSSQLNERAKLGYNTSFASELNAHYELIGIPVIITAQCIYGLVYAVFTILIGVLEIAFIAKNGYILKLGIVKRIFQESLVNTGFYRIIMFFLSLHYIMQFLVQLNIIGGEDDKGTRMGIITMNERVFLIFGIFYFLQIFPSIGYFAIGFQKMLSTLALFALLEMLIIYLFSTLFRHVNMYYCQPSAVSCNDSESLYQSFLVMLNMVPLIENSKKCYQPGIQLLEVLHIVYTFVVSILSINYLISVMLSVYDMFTLHRDSAVTMHRVHMILVVERRLCMFMSLLPERWLPNDNIDIVVDELDYNCEGMDNLRLMNVAGKNERTNNDVRT